MKKLPIIVFLLGTTLAQANLIDDPAKFIGTSHVRFFDEARSMPYDVFGIPYPPGWVSQFGALNGGQYFFTNLFEQDPGPTALVSWDFSGTEFFMRWVNIWGLDEDGTQWIHYYQVPHKFQFQDAGELVQLNPQGTGRIVSISFSGASIFNLPDSGSTILLFTCSLLGLLTLTRKQLA